MLLKKLALTNFGQFRGRHTLDLTPKEKRGQKRPIILIGGHNGAGKTTILEAIKLALYGPALLGSRVGRQQYQEHLTQTIHRNKASLIPIDSASVELEFEFIAESKKASYTIIRSWTKKGASIAETFSVLKDDSPIDDLDEEHWQDFVRELIPQGLSNLFFFDGEKIQSLAEDASSTQGLSDSVKSLLGLDLIERLQADLKIYYYRLCKTSDNGLSKGLTKLEETTSQTNLLFRNVTQNRAETRTLIEKCEAELSRKEEKLRQAGGVFAQKRDLWKQRKAESSAIIDRLQQEIRELCAELFPFSLCPSLLTNLKNHLNQERLSSETGAVRSHIRKNEQSLRSKWRKDPAWKELSLTEKAAQRLENNLVSALMDSVATPSKGGKTTSIHKLSPSGAYALENQIDRALNEISPKAKALFSELEQHSRRLQKTEIQIRKTPDEDSLVPLFDEIGKLNQELGMWREKASLQDEELKQLAFRKETAEKALKKAHEELANQEALTDRLRLVDKTQGSLAKYQKELNLSKIRSLESEFIRCFDQLFQKSGYIKNVSIDHDSFIVTLYDKELRPKPKTELSAGEKQIFAIAMLWALARTSGRVLPLIIDTPLGRLDSRHRYHLVENYFPYASHQVLILSTDTEIDESHFESLSPWISHAFHLDYDGAEESSKITPGYFWTHKKERELVGASS